MKTGEKEMLGRFSACDEGESKECKDISQRGGGGGGGYVSFPSIFRSEPGREKVRYTAWHTLTISAARNTVAETPLGGAGCARCGESKFASVYFRQGRRTRLDYAGLGIDAAPFLHRENVFVNIHPTHEARAASSSSCRCKSLYININASSACTTYSCPLHSQLVLRIAESAESSTEFTAPQPWTTSSQYLCPVSPFSLSARPFLLCRLPHLVRIK